MFDIFVRIEIAKLGKNNNYFGMNSSSWNDDCCCYYKEKKDQTIFCVENMSCMFGKNYDSFS